MRVKVAGLRFLFLGLGLIACFYQAEARAEYRVFILKIEDSTTGQSRAVKTTLDHLQYAGYYPVRQTENVTIAETWMCRNRSDVSQDIEQKYCVNPRAPASQATTQLNSQLNSQTNTPPTAAKP